MKRTRSCISSRVQVPHSEGRQVKILLGSEVVSSEVMKAGDTALFIIISFFLPTLTTQLS